MNVLQQSSGEIAQGQKNSEKSLIGGLEEDMGGNFDREATKVQRKRLEY